MKQIDKDKFSFNYNGKKEISSISVKSAYFLEHVDVKIPGSKSFTNRATVLAAMTGCEIILTGFLFSEDTYWGLFSIQEFGFQVLIDYENFCVKILPPKIFTIQKFNLFLGKAGTLARFFPALILNWNKIFLNSLPITVTLDAHEQLKKRPLSDLIYALKKLGANILVYTLPLTITSSDLKGECEISGRQSSQFLSGLLLAAAGSKNTINIHRRDNLVQPDYVKMTIESIHSFHGEVSYNEELTEFSTYNPNGLNASKYEIEADASSLCYFITLAFLHNFNLKIKNIGSNSLQPDYKFIEILKLMGANICSTPNETIVSKISGERLIKGGLKLDFTLLSDQALTIGVIALFANAPIEVYGIEHIRQHESDRISCFVKNLNSLNLKVEEKNDGFIIFPADNISSLCGCWETWHDHRFVMSGFILASFAHRIEINNPSCVEKTWPNFFNDVEKLGFHLRIT